jgi:hypothetical protein
MDEEVGIMRPASTRQSRSINQESLNHGKTQRTNERRSEFAVVFVTLKLCGVITWSWWWVTAPFWGVFAILIFLGLVFGVIWLGIAAYDWATSR